MLTLLLTLVAMAVIDGIWLGAVARGFYRRHLAWLLLVGVGAAGALMAFAATAATDLSVTALLPPVYRLFAAAVGAYLLLAVGALNSGLLFGVGRPGPSVAATALGTAASLLVGGVAGLAWPAEWAAMTGLLVGTAVFAALTTLAAGRTFARFDTYFYRAF